MLFQIFAGIITLCIDHPANFLKVRYLTMKKNIRQLIAIIALAAIVVLISAFAVSAFTAAPGESGNRFIALLSCIVAIPILTWLLLFCIGRLQHTHTIAELSPSLSIEMKTRKVIKQPNITDKQNFIDFCHLTCYNKHC